MNPSKNAANTVGTLEKLFEEQFGKKVEKIEPLPVSGSDRRYFRLIAGTDSAIGTLNTNVAENNTYFYVTELFKKNQINVPLIYKVSKDRKSYLQQDLGKTSLFDKLTNDGFTDQVKKYYLAVIEQLTRIHWIAGRDADFRQCYASRQFDEKTILSDLLYFKYYFADLQGIPYDRALLFEEMELLSRDLGRVQPLTFMYRDFQSRNIMIHENQLYFIDFQGFMQGPPQYDIASLLWQARAQVPASLKEELLNHYFTSLNELHVARIDDIYFRRIYVQFVLVRLLQVLGSYGFRGLLQHKAHFVASIGPALHNLQKFLDNHPQIPSYPELRGLLEKLCTPDMQKKYTFIASGEKPKLQVAISSFSYKYGLPKTNSPHGGGYVFDCRGILNPGRYSAYKCLTGNDEMVCQFLERETTMPDFMDHVNGLLALHVQNYIARGFEQLTVAFGCTGGQHRSVYAANKLADYLRHRFNVEVSVTHLNEPKWVLTDIDGNDTPGEKYTSQGII